MREERIARSASAALMVLAVAFAPLYILFGFAFASAMLAFGSACAAVGTAVGLRLGKRHTALQLLAALLPAAALAFIVPIGLQHGLVIARYAMLGAGVLLALWTERLALRPPAPGRMVGVLLAPLAVLLAVCASLWLQSRSAASSSPGMWALMITIASVWLVAALFLLNRNALRQAAYASNGGGVPAGARRSGAVGVAVFAAAAFVLASIGAIARAIADAIKWLIVWLVNLYVYLAGLLSAQGPQGQPMPTKSPDEMPPLPQGDASPFMKLLSDILLYVCIIAVAAGLLYGLYKLLPKLWRWLVARIGGMFSTWREDEGYVDRSESLMNLRQALADAGSGLKKFARRFRRRPRLADFPTNAGKARFLFREYLHGLVAARREPPPSATATDIARPAPALASAYNRARYAEEEPSNSEIEKAKDSVRIK
jgi:hypothetical protein